MPSGTTLRVLFKRFVHICVIMVFHVFLGAAGSLYILMPFPKTSATFFSFTPAWKLPKKSLNAVITIPFFYMTDFPDGCNCSFEELNEC